MKKTILILVVSLFLGSMMMMATNENVIWGNYVTYKSSTEIYLTAGSGRCNGSVWEHATETTLDLTSVLPVGEDFVYIYVDDSASALNYPTATFIGSTTEPAWSNPLIGWYNGDDRCIGVVWVNSSGDIEEFQNNSSQEYLIVDTYLKQVLTNGNPDGNWNPLTDASDYTPVNTISIFANATNADAGAVTIKVAAYENTNSLIWTWMRESSAVAIGWISLQRGWSRDLQWLGASDDNNNFNVYVMGFRIDR